MSKLTHIELADTLKKQNLIKRDFVVPSSCLRMNGNKLEIIHRSGGNDALEKMLSDTGIATTDSINSSKLISLDILEVAHEQIGEKLGIHKSYYDKMLAEKEHFGLLNENVNYWLGKLDKNLFIRSFIDPDKDSGICRALLSDKFFSLDNYDVFFASLEAVKDSGIKLDILNCDITDKKMYVRFVAPEIEVQSPELLKAYRVPDGNGSGNTGIMSGFVISNSEVGHGQFSISPRVVINACTNGIIWREDAFSQRHLGSKMEEYSEIKWSNETFHKNKELVISQIKDWVKTYVNAEWLGKKIDALMRQGTQKLQHPTETITNVCTEIRKKVYLNEEKENTLLNYFIGGGTNTAFGVSQAVTYYAQHNANPDDQYELEMFGAELISNIKMYDKAADENKKKKTVKVNPN